jgi:superfamily II DNA/RNA helicase
MNNLAQHDIDTDTRQQQAAAITSYHAKYYAYELTAKRSSAVVDRLTTSLFDAHVDLNPHQIEAALFALRSPLSKGVILADEVGLGKTIEAGILLCQYWAEHKKQLLVVCPASLRRQWSIELEEKFNLSSIILENDTYKARSKNKDKHPLRHDGVIIMSYQFANRLKDEMHKVPWDLVVIDEAHKLRNLYRNDNKMGKNIQYALEGFKKVLLTATPLQNSLMELYGLASLIDDRIFGSVESFRSRYASGDPRLEELKERMKPFVHRTLRSQVLEYINYTRREAITQPFTPTEKEQELYDRVSDFLLEQDTYAIPWAQRKLVVLIIRKLMASSAFALVGTLQTIKARLEDIKRTGKEKELNIRKNLIGENDMDTDFIEEINGDKKPAHKGRPINFQKLEYEIEQVEQFEALARSIKVESKAKELLKALDIGFKRMSDLGGKRKALIFTESSRTQRYLKEFLTDNGYKGKIVTFNGQNNDELARSIYRKWAEQEKDTGRITGTLNVDVRMSLVDFFRDEGEIMIATEAAAEGINLQFCSMVVNYDLPWNPQRVEQRIGRVHRYGQKHDVVVINFLNKTNWADQRIYQLLKEKFQLFDGVFGASDEILGQIESGVDFEKRIYDIFDTCRKPEEIEQAFTELQSELDEPIQAKLTEARHMLFEHFDEDVHQKLKFCMESTQKRMDDVTRMFWALTKYIYLIQHQKSSAYHNSEYFFNDETLIFGTDEEFIRQGERPEEHNDVPIYYYLDMVAPTQEQKETEYEETKKRSRALRRNGNLKNPRQGSPHRLSNIQGEMVLKNGKEMEIAPSTLTFKLSEYPHRIAMLDEYVGTSGWLFLNRITIDTFEEVEHLLFTVCNDDGDTLKSEIGEKLFLLPADIQEGAYTECPYMAEVGGNVRYHTSELLKSSEFDNHSYFNEELDKLDRWAEDLKNGLELELKKIDKDIRELGRQSKQMVSLQEKLSFQKQKATLEKRRTKKRHELYDSQDEIDKQRDMLIKQIEKQIQETSHNVEELFRVQWTLQ